MSEYVKSEHRWLRHRVSFRKSLSDLELMTASEARATYMRLQTWRNVLALTEDYMAELYMGKRLVNTEVVSTEDGRTVKVRIPFDAPAEYPTDYARGSIKSMGLCLFLAVALMAEYLPLYTALALLGFSVFAPVFFLLTLPGNSERAYSVPFEYDVPPSQMFKKETFYLDPAKCPSEGAQVLVEYVQEDLADTLACAPFPLDTDAPA